jgi:hypothetical protein
MRSSIVLVRIAVALSLGVIAASPSAAAPPSLRPGGPPVVDGLRVLSGSLHDHTTDSDGDSASPDVVRWWFDHRAEIGIDVATLSDHSDAFPLALGSPSTPDPWARQAEVVAEYTHDGFTVLRGFELTNDQENHLNVIGSENWTARSQVGEATLRMDLFWTWLATPPLHDPSGRGLGYGGADGIGQFNHPSAKGALNWDDYAFDPSVASQMALIEVHGGQGRDDLDRSDAGWYWFALAQGWTVSPVMNWDWHDYTGDGILANPAPGAGCGTGGFLPCQRSLVLSRATTPEAILEGLRLRRTSASQRPDLWATLRGPGGEWQGSTIGARPGEEITLVVDAGSGTQPLTSVDIVSDAGVSPYPYYYGDNTPCDASGCDPGDFEHSQLTPSYVEQHRRYVASGGHATRKARIDAPPPGTVIATVALSGARTRRTIRVRVPDEASPRPDGAHFFYAIVHAGAARAWTGPILADAAAPRGEWLAGDTHVHDDHSSDGSLTRQASDQRLPGNNSITDQIDAAIRNGLDFLPLTDHRTYDQHWDPLWTSDQVLLVPGEEANGSPHATVHGAVDTIVQGANPPGSPPFRRVQTSIWDAHAQDANWGTAHPDDGETNDDGSPNANASAVGIDTVEVLNRASNPEAEIDYAETRWNRGFHFGVAGASDDHFKEINTFAGPGQPTTWVFAARRSMRAIVDGLRAGRTSVSSGVNGPFLTLEADADGDGVYETMGGDEAVAGSGATVPVRARVRRGSGTTVVVYRSPGRSAGPIASFSPALPDETFDVPIRIAAGQSWVRAEVRGAGIPSALGAPADPANQLQAIASPIFFSTTKHGSAAAEIPLPPDDRTVDGATLVVGATRRFAGFADVAVSGGTTHVVAEAQRDGETHVIYRRLSAGVPGPETDLGSGSARFPAIAALGNDVWVVWQDGREGELPNRPDIYLRRSTNGGTTWLAEVRLTDGSGRAEHPAITLLDAAHPVVAWAENTGGAFDIRTLVVGLDAKPANVSIPGKTIDPGTPDDTRSPQHPASLFPAVAVRSDGTIAVAWQDDRFDPDPLWTGHTPPPGSEESGGTDPDDWEILAAVRRRGGKTWSPPARVSGASDLADRHPDIAFDAAGRLVAIWDAKALHSSGANLSIRAATSNDGKSWTAPAPVALNVDAMSQRPRLGRNASGVVRAVWYDSRSADWRWKVFSASLGPVGWSAPQRLSGGSNGTWPAADGTAVVFTSDRGALRTQRDRTQQVFVLVK